MIDPKLLKENLSAISSNLKNKNYMLDKDEFLKIDSDRKELILENESLKNKKNLLSKEIGILKSNGEDSTEKTKAVEVINLKLESIKKLLLEAEEKFKNLLLNIPNILDDSVPIGSSEDDNKIEYYSDNINLLENENQNYPEHNEIGKLLGQYDQEAVTKMSGTRFSILFDKFAELHRALGSFMLDIHTKEHNYKSE